MPGERPRQLASASAAIPTSVRRGIRRAGFQFYHRLLGINYARELFARPVSTPAGTISTYELADTHSEDSLLAALIERAGPADVIYDVGAYTGVYALALAVDAPRRTVVAFEPNGESIRRLEKNRERTDPAGTILVEAIGVGEQSATATFYHSTFPKLSSFDRADATRWGARVRETESIPIRPLDSVLSAYPPPDHVKIDVEGHAPAVLRGARSLIENHRPVLYVEPHDRPGTDRTAAIERFCDNHSYEVEQYPDGLLCTP